MVQVTLFSRLKLCQVKVSLRRGLGCLFLAIAMPDLPAKALAQPVEAEPSLRFALGAELSSDGALYDSRVAFEPHASAYRADFTLGLQKNTAMFKGRASFRSGYKNLLFPEFFVSDRSSLGLNVFLGRLNTPYSVTFGTDLNSVPLLGFHALDGVLFEWDSDPRFANESSADSPGVAVAVHVVTTLASETDMFDWDKPLSVQQGRGAVIFGGHLRRERIVFAAAVGHEPRPMITHWESDYPKRVAQKYPLTVAEGSFLWKDQEPLPNVKIGAYIGRIWDRNLEQLSDVAPNFEVENPNDGNAIPMVNPYKVKTLQLISLGATATSLLLGQTQPFFMRDDFAFLTFGSDFAQDSLSAQVQTWAASVGYQSLILRAALAYSFSFASEQIYFSEKRSAILQQPTFVDKYHRVVLKFAFQVN